MGNGFLSGMMIDMGCQKVHRLVACRCPSLEDVLGKILAWVPHNNPFHPVAGGEDHGFGDGAVFVDEACGHGIPSRQGETLPNFHWGGFMTEANDVDAFDHGLEGTEAMVRWEEEVDPHKRSQGKQKNGNHHLGRLAPLPSQDKALVEDNGVHDPDA